MKYYFLNNLSNIKLSCLVIQIKSYESISSNSSDSKILENEPFYDTVPLDNGEGDYVYIQSGGNGSNSSRDDISTAGSTLPMPPNKRESMNGSQSSVFGEPESPGRNYANLEYFLRLVIIYDFVFGLHLYLIIVNISVIKPDEVVPLKMEMRGNN